jgi:hypothetical protein
VPDEVFLRHLRPHEPLIGNQLRAAQHVGDEMGSS